jgi:protein ImuB
MTRRSATRRDRAASERRALLAPPPRAAALVLRPETVVAADARADAGAGAAAGTDAGAAELWVAVHLPELIFDATWHASEPAASPRAVFELQSGVQRLVAVDAAAQACSIAVGASLAAGLALSPDLQLRRRAPRRERERVLRLAEAALGFSPRVSLEWPDALLLEVRGSLALFGGMATLLSQIAVRAAGEGLRARLALAPTPRAALVLARMATSAAAATVPQQDRLVGALAPLPLAALRWPPERLERLAAMGVRTLGEVLRLPRAGFARRFGREALLELDRLVGRAAEPRVPFASREWFRGRCEPGFELETHDAVMRHTAPLLEDLQRYLRRRQQAITELHLTLRHRPTPRCLEPRATRVPLRLAAPEWCAEPLAALLAEHLARIELVAPVMRLELRSGALQALEAGTSALWQPGEHGGTAGRESTTLIERLRARLGADAVYGLCIVPEHRPERAWRIAEPGARLQGSQATTSSHLRRPLWLLREPERLASDLAGFALLEGPERIETGWWDGADVARDYYVARDRAGARLWLFRERTPPHAWFLQGVFG